MIVAIDCAGPRAVAVAADSTGSLVAGGVGSGTRQHAEDLGPLLVEVTAGDEEINSVVVGVGPGSFTGLRVGMAAGESLAWSLGVEVRGVCTLDVVASSVPDLTGYAVLDARRREVFWAQYEEGVRIGEPHVSPRLELAELAADARVVGDVELLSSPSAGQTVVAPDDLAKCAAQGPFVPVLPMYLRVPNVGP